MTGVFQYLGHPSFNLHVHHDKKAKCPLSKRFKSHADLLYLNCSSDSADKCFLSR